MKKDTKQYFLWEKIAVLLVSGLILVQGGFFQESYLLAGCCLSFLLLKDRQPFQGDTTFLLSLGVLGGWSIIVQITHVTGITQVFSVGYVICFLVLYLLGVQKKEILRSGIFLGILLMECIGVLAYIGIPMRSIVENHRFMGTFQYANTTAIVLVFVILYGKAHSDSLKWAERMLLLHYVFLFLTCSVGGIVCYLLAVSYLFLQKKDDRKDRLLSEILTVAAALTLAGIIYWVSFQWNVKALNILVFAVGIALSWNWTRCRRYCLGNAFYRRAGWLLGGGWIGIEAFLGGAFLFGKRAGGTFQERIWQMQDGMKVLQKHLWLGVGNDGWKEHMLEWRNHDYEVSIIHNSYLHIGAAKGIIAVLILLGITGYLLYGSRKWEIEERAILYIGILHALFDIDFFFMGYCAAILLVVARPAEQKQWTDGGQGIRYRKICLSIAGGSLLFGWAAYLFIR